MNIDPSYKGREAVVIGASSGIGSEISKRLLSAGAHVIGVSRYFDKYPSDIIMDSYFHPIGLDLSTIKLIEPCLRQKV